LEETLKDESIQNQRIEAIKISTGRSIFYFIALLINIVASIVLARKLVPQDYAIYQLVTKRIISYGTIPLSIFSLWIYRYVVEKNEGSYYASLTFSIGQALFSFILGIILVLLYTKVNPIILIIAGVSLALQAFYYTVRTIVDAARPLRMGFLELIYRISYASLIFVLIYLISASLLYAFIGTAISFLLSSILAIYWLKDKIHSDKIVNTKKILKEWTLGSHATVLGVVFGLIPSFDVMIAYPLVGDLVVAAFFVVSSISTLLRDSTNVGLRYLHSYVLRTGDLRTALRNMELSLAIVIPFLMYGVIYPKYVVYVYNPIYSWASIAISVFLIIAIIEILNNGIGQIASGSIKDRGVKAAKGFAKMNILGLIPSLFYIGSLALIFVLFKGISLTYLILLWAIVYLIRYAISAIVNAKFFLPSNVIKTIIKEMIPRIILYSLISLAISYFLKPLGAPSPRLLTDIKYIAIPGLIEVALFYLVVIGIDKGVRRHLIKLLKERIL
jgi:hypothetical protein